MTKVQIGSISTGALHDEDLLGTFSVELKRLENCPLRSSLLTAVHDFKELKSSGNLAQAMETEFAAMTTELIGKLTDALNEYAPPHTYFGSHPGNGADFGFWAVEN